MPEPDANLIHVLRQWITKAEDDLVNASHTLKLGASGPLDTIGFHAQQCVEKYLKALLVWQGIPFTKTHDLNQLVGMLPVGLQPSLSLEEQRALTRYATVTRYPGDYDPITLAEARRVRRQARRWLPKAAVKR